MYEIDDRTLPAQHVCVITRKLPVDDIPSWLPGVYGRVMKYPDEVGN